MQYLVGDVVECIVSSIVNFGVFVKIDSNHSGLIHISQISNEYIKEISDVLHIGQKVKCKILSIDENNKYNLSMKSVSNNISCPPDDLFLKNQEKVNMSFEDMLTKYKKSSEEKISILKKSMQKRYNRRSGR